MKVTITFDGTEVEAVRGEPVCAAIVRSGTLAIARSAKFHRPRGPSCMRGACDGCLARVDEQPNIMTCLVPAEEGLTVTSQNTLGSREVDFLRVTDWFFPEGMNHHELFAGVPGVQQVMQAFARRVAGLGKLPKEAVPVRPAPRREVEAVVVGSGPAGMAAAALLAKQGKKVEVLDDALAAGGSMRALGGWTILENPFTREVNRGSIRLRTSTTLGGIYEDELLVAGDDGAEVLKAKTLVLAPGCHDGVLAFEGNDVPGVMSARAGGLLLSHGAVPADRVLVVIPEGGGPFGEAFARAAQAEPARCEVTVVRGDPLEVSGSSQVKKVRVATAEGEKTFKAGALLVDAPRSPAYELCAQAGAKLRHEPRGYVAEGPRIRPGVYAVGEVIGTPLDPQAILESIEGLFVDERPEQA
jgi:sarcosine oxidase subunit alpha